MIFDEIFKSATKIVLLSLVGALIALIFASLNNASNFAVVVDIFKTVILMVVAFYFGQKTNTTPTEADIKSTL